jgi:hypothetical protein
MRFAGRGKPRGSIWQTRADVAIGCHEQTLRLFGRMSALPSILLQKSKVAGLRIFAKNPKRKQSPIRITSTGLAKSLMSLTCGDEAPSHLYTKSAPVALEFLSASAKGLFATQSPQQADWQFWLHAVIIRQGFESEKLARSTAVVLVIIEDALPDFGLALPTPAVEPFDGCRT